MNVPITQSEQWKKLQDDLNEKSFYETGEDYTFLAILKTTPAGNYLYLPYGPVAGTKKGMKEALNSLVKIAKKCNAIFIRIEPQNPKLIENLPYMIKKTTDLDPRETWVLDLTGNDDELRAKLPSRLLRYHKNATNKGIQIIESHNPDDIMHLIKLQKALADQKGINTFSKDYLRTEATQPFSTIYLAKYHNPDTDKDEIIAAGLVFDDEKTRYNLQGAQNDTGRKLHATGILTIQLILDAKEKGLQTFDFWGIAPEGAPENHPWAGFTNFKKTFAGYEVDYAGTHDIIINKPKYRLYQALRKVNRLRRRA